MNSAMRKAAILLVLTGMLLSACGTNLWGAYDPYLTPTPTSIVTVLADPEPTPTKIILPLSTTQAATIPPSPTVTPTTPAVTPGTPHPSIVYSSQSGDSLEAVALHFGVQVSEITSPVGVSLPKTGFLNPDTTLIIPDLLSQTPATPSRQIIPDCELVYSPCAQNFNIKDYVNSADGILSTFIEDFPPLGRITGAEGVQRIALGSSISPRMLLALIQYYTGWVQGQPKPGLDQTYPLGYQNDLYKGLYQQLRLLVQDLLAGYYGWRDGTLKSLIFLDGTTRRLAPGLNAGSVALQYMFSRHLNYKEWLEVLYPENPETGFPALFTSMFGIPWERAQATGPLFPPDLKQPNFTLPFEVGVPWNFTYGPHPAWEAESALGALDFAPSGISGCDVSNAWVVAIASGQIVRSESSYVVLDLDGDGFEQTGWVVLYQHIATKDRIPVGGVTAGAHIGHPSCDGGTATGTHTHIARKYNGEWVAAGGPLPFVLSGWTADAGSLPGYGTLTKDDKVVTASPVSSPESEIIRKKGE